MSINQSYAIEVERETASTRLMLSRIPNDQLGWKPHEKSMSLGALATHVVEMNNWVSLVLTTESFDFKTQYQPLNFNTVEEMITALDEGLKENLTLINAMTDEKWFENWTLTSGDYVISKAPRVGSLRFFVQNHIYHHRGQLSVYLRLLNIPVPGMYGPSADDQM